MSVSEATSDDKDAETESTEAEPASLFELVGDRAFGPFFATNSLSNIGNWFQNVAAGIVVFEPRQQRHLSATVRGLLPQNGPRVVRPGGR